MGEKMSYMCMGMGMGVLLTLFLEFIMMWGTLGHGLID